MSDLSEDFEVRDEPAVLADDLFEDFAGDLSVDFAVDFAAVVLDFVAEPDFSEAFEGADLDAGRVAEPAVDFDDFVRVVVFEAGLSVDFDAVFFSAAAAGFSAAGFVTVAFSFAGTAAPAVAVAGRDFALAGSDMATRAATVATISPVVSSSTRFMAVNFLITRVTSEGISAPLKAI
ncbi:MAG: hypothetical protein RL215_2656 [Planctomycetota bacterium]|jgi:hypothetical protein